MTKHWIEPDQTRDRASTVGQLLPPTQRDSATLCDRYDAGHQIHYAHQAEAERSPAEEVHAALVDGTLLTLRLDGDRELRWRNHDPARLLRMLGLVHGRGTAYPQLHALRVGPYWFNCATEGEPWEDCRLSRAAHGE